MAVCLAHILPHQAGVILLGIPMIGATDIRIAYANAFRNLHNLATDYGKVPVASAPWYPNRGNVILSQSFLRSEIILNPNTSNYQFGILNTQLTNSQSTIARTEQRLTLQDVFFVSQIGYYFCISSSSGGDTEYANHLFTHPPGQLWNSTSLLNNLDALWQGELALNVNNRVVTTAWDLWRHYETPETQYPVFNTFSGNEQIVVNDEHYGSQSGVFPCEPMWILNGSYDNILNCTYNASLASVIPAAPAIYKCVLILRGILAQNCSKIMEPGNMNPS